MTQDPIIQPPCLTVPRSEVFADHPWAGAGYGVVTWLFVPGMMFGTRFKWWDANGARKQPHEGVDFCCFMTEIGEESPLGSDTTVPLLYDGEIVRCLDDFLGKSLFVRHAYHREKLVLYTVYGHVMPEPRLTIGSKVPAGKIIARVAGGRENKSKVPSHLHLSIALVPQNCEAVDLDWKRLIQPDVIMCDPLQLVTLDYQIRENIYFK